MRIVAIRDIVSPIRSNIANAYIDFSQMTASVVAVETDLKVEGKPVIGYGFNSNGRYGQGGLIRERFAPCGCYGSGPGVNSAIDSTCAVCGNMLTTPTA